MGRYVCLAVVIASCLFTSACSTTPSRSDRANALKTQYKTSLEAAWNSTEMANVRGKTALWDDAILPSMTLNPDYPSDSEKKAMVFWADRLASLSSLQTQAFVLSYPEQWAMFFRPVADDYSKREIDAAIAMAKGNLTWGKYNEARIRNYETAKTEIRITSEAATIGAAQAAASQPSGTSSPLDALLRPQAPPRQTTCTSFINGRWVTTTCQ